MYGRGRGTYLGLLLESQIGKSAVATTADDEENKTSYNAVNEEKGRNELLSPKTLSYNSQDEKKSSQPTWTSLDLLGNRGKRNRRGSDSSPKPSEENPQVCEDDQRRKIQDDPPPSSSVSSDISPDEKVMTDPVKKVHLITPQEFLPIPKASSTINDGAQADISEIDTSSNNSQGSSSSSSRYIPPHLRKGFSGKPDICPDPAITKYKKIDGPTYTLPETLPENASPQKMVESELNWQKWKLERSIKKVLNNLSVENVIGLSVDISKACEASQLSKKFPGTSEVNVLADLLVARIIDQKDSFEIVVPLCCLLNVIYKDEFPANLKDVLRQYRQETFAGIANKNSRCDNFCVFLGKLCDVAKGETKSFQDCLRQSVIACLYDWISAFQTVDEYSQETELKVSYLCYLLEVTKSVLTTEKGTWVKSCFGKIKNCILNEKVSRSVKENLLDHVIKCSLQSPTMKETEIPKTNVETLPSMKTSMDLNLADDAYKNVKKMLSDLELSNLSEKFQDNLIRDTLLCAEKNELKNTLQEAGFAPGAILEIQLYLEKNGNSFRANVVEKTQETKLDRYVDPQTRIRNLESDLKEILSNIEKQKEKEIKNETEEQEETEKQNDIENIQALDLKELQNKLTNYQNSLEESSFTSPCRPPPGFSYPREENPSALLPEDPQPANGRGLSSVVREVSLGERKNNIMEFKDENTQVGNPIVNRTQNDGKKNFNDRSFVKYKGRGRGRRDITGTLESSKDNSPSEPFSGVARWNSRDIKGFQYGTAGGIEGYPSQWNRNEKVYSRPQSDLRDRKGYYDVSSGYTEESSRLTKASSKDSLEDDTGEPQKPSTEFGSLWLGNAGFGTFRAGFGSSVPLGCFICGGKDHRSAYCKNNAAMFD